MIKEFVIKVDTAESDYMGGTPLLETPQEICRCKDCKYWQDNNGGYPHPECRWGHDETPEEDDFCSFGERR